MESPIYLDYNATTPIDPEVANEMLPFFQDFFGNPSTAYAIGRASKEAIAKARKQVANLINANPEEIVFTGSATESNNLAIHGFMLANKNKGTHIITSAVEHPAVTEVCRYLSTLGYQITYIEVDGFGRVNPNNVEKAIRPDTALITIMHANNEVGTIQPISEIAAIAKKNNIAFHTDASQSVGKIEADVTKLGVDLLTIAGHKIYAPKGVGALYIKEGIKIQNIVHGAGQEHGIRPGTENVMHLVGLGKACEIAHRDFEKNHQNMRSTRDALLSGLRKYLADNVLLNADLQNCLPNTLSISFKKVEAHTLASVISKTICISTGSACHADSIEISSVLKAMNLDSKKAAGTIRISTGKHTTVAEIEAAVQLISDAVKKLSI
ncbi:MAG: cysteine desulfurase family protein [Salinivirgaceae bacterium]